MTGYGKKYEVIVVGAGHAGCEAALAAARMGCLTLLLTMGLDTVAQMSCNPSIGGLAKGHLVHEIDALGGEMGLNIDDTGIQFRRLNMRKGPAVRAGRAQADRMAYSARMKLVLESVDLLDLKQGVVDEVVVKNYRVVGVRTREGIEFSGQTVVITAGTFMRGLIHVGMNNYPGGRAGEPAADKLSDCLRSLGFVVGRLKTGTPARLSARSIDFGKLERQSGDNEIRPFSFMNDKIERNQVDCYIAHTNQKTHEIIRNNLDKSPLYAGVIEGVGPRYCPSIEDKVVRFPDKMSHQSFIEPEGVRGAEMYPSGLSTSLPADVQLQYFRSMVGFERVEIMRPGYAIEYDFVEPLQIQSTMETREVAGLYHAGQINGTSGYEEAAGQGLLAGINAALQCQQSEPLIIRRDQGYLGVMVDDLVTQETTEPYRMFTSRAEYRLLLREDNADLRLTQLGRHVGLVSDSRWQRYQEKLELMERAFSVCRDITVTNKNARLCSRFGLGELKSGVTLEQVIKRPEVTVRQVEAEVPELTGFPEKVLEQVEIAIKYEGYIARQIEQVERFVELEKVKIPDDLDYAEVTSISAEVREKLIKYRPSSLGQAGRIQGVTPAAVAVLNVYLRKKTREKTNEAGR
ncbi:tRNA uridine-5-carboxymethylaminomethyl(34) synthesis enzyme MnmG [Pelovirga terrestris]|uniref:tRNA uridine 5-carboxymethylaminomethyl modification enzyme MnmG n=1 Tax=Pelovirga terrestris TaxID=2771352 RepID=A0A8J6QQE2_9BACT|nr:tRNA uridine-5-carboxymethylaminomethyl(34) synthesis enzyme MnmG [Pelovirga terrestris]MBD1399880.1 tRNA uridine-5-carboxymethylaminomethyl(34) synthesis enzyme MnmG [Pelovirga terrestris]